MGLISLLDTQFWTGFDFDVLGFQRSASGFVGPSWSFWNFWKKKTRRGSGIVAGIWAVDRTWVFDKISNERSWNRLSNATEFAKFRASMREICPFEVSMEGNIKNKQRMLPKLKTYGPLM
uniref:Uncharacterized protein n=1 Tax=Solanum tuberosum TaxID=4113 RepID=M1DLJ4_SOLTU